MLRSSSTSSTSSPARLRLARFPRLHATPATHGRLPSCKRQRSTATPYATPHLVAPSCTASALGARARTHVPTYVCCTLPLDSSAPFCALTSPLRTPTQLSARCICPSNQAKCSRHFVACLAAHHTRQHNKIVDVPPCFARQILHSNPWHHACLAWSPMLPKCLDLY